jgi:hypothetical protein
MGMASIERPGSVQDGNVHDRFSFFFGSGLSSLYYVRINGKPIKAIETLV